MSQLLVSVVILKEGGVDGWGAVEGRKREKRRREGVAWNPADCPAGSGDVLVGCRAALFGCC